MPRKPLWERVDLLPCIGRQVILAEPGDDFETYTLELRNCRCGSTLAVELPGIVD